VRAGLSIHRVHVAGVRTRTRRKTCAYGYLAVAAALWFVAVALPVWAQETCSAAFAQWVKLSESRIARHREGPGADKTQATCIAGEPQRRELLRALVSVRDRCQASVATDGETEHVRMMIGINEGFIGTIALCPTEAPKREVAKAKAEGVPAASQAHSRQCLHLARVAVDRYALTNSRCSGTTVLAVIETQAPSGTIACKGYSVATSIAVPGKSPLTLNFECAIDQKKCTRERVAAMFPECDW
jgi:hypothetical protein